jgi:hypothetical protein
VWRLIRVFNEDIFLHSNAHPGAFFPSFSSRYPFSPRQPGAAPLAQPADAAASFAAASNAVFNTLSFIPHHPDAQHATPATGAIAASSATGPGIPRTSSNPVLLASAAAQASAVSLSLAAPPAARVFVAAPQPKRIVSAQAFSPRDGWHWPEEDAFVHFARHLRISGKSIGAVCEHNALVCFACDFFTFLCKQGVYSCLIVPPFVTPFEFQVSEQVGCVDLAQMWRLLRVFYADETDSIMPIAPTRMGLSSSRESEPASLAAISAAAYHLFASPAAATRARTGLNQSEVDEEAAAFQSNAASQYATPNQALVDTLDMLSDPLSAFGLTADSQECSFHAHAAHAHPISHHSASNPFAAWQPSPLVQKQQLQQQQLRQAKLAAAAAAAALEESTGDAPPRPAASDPSAATATSSSSPAASAPSAQAADPNEWHIADFRTEMVASTLEMCADRGDVQTCVLVLLVLGHDRLPAPARRAQLWFHSYIELLHRHRMWAQATDIIRRSRDETIRDMNKKMTTVAQSCPHCHAMMMQPGFVCAKCRRAVSPCSLCQQPVVGAWAWCQGCGHGGHLAHMQSWFRDGNTTCPAGCLHQCTMRQCA